MRETPANEQALARLERGGPSVLSLAELLQVVLDGRSDPLLPLRLLKQWGTLSELAHADPADLMALEGMSRLRVARLRAALELGRRLLTEPLQERPCVHSPSEVAYLLIPEMGGLFLFLAFVWVRLSSLFSNTGKDIMELSWEVK